MAASLFQTVLLPRSSRRLKNRLVMAPMPTFSARKKGGVSDAELAYYQRRASGGLAAVITAGCAVAAGGLCVEGQWRCDDSRFLPSLQTAAAAIHKGGALAVLQLCHGGKASLAEDAKGPEDLSEPDVEALLETFAAAARRAERAGFDGVEIHGGHGYLAQQFFSRKTNSRAWAWGGPSAAERMAFPRALVEAALNGCGKRFSLWYRLTPEEEGDGGITMDETLELAAELARCGVEVLDVAVRDASAPSPRDPEDRKPRAALVHKAVGDRCCVMAAGRIAKPSQAEKLVKAGVPLIGLGRILLTEPDWANKVQAGEAKSLRDRVPSDATLEKLDLPQPLIDFLRKNKK